MAKRQQASSQAEVLPDGVIRRHMVTVETATGSHFVSVGDIVSLSPPIEGRKTQGSRAMAMIGGNIIWILNTPKNLAVVLGQSPNAMAERQKADKAAERRRREAAMSEDAAG